MIIKRCKCGTKTNQEEIAGNLRDLMENRLKRREPGFVKVDNEDCKEAKRVDDSLSQILEISKEQFVYLIGYVEALDDIMSDVEVKIGSVFEDFFGILKTRSLSTELLKWIGEQVGDEETKFGSTLEWYMYEMKDFDEKSQCITFTKPTEKKMMTRTPEELYDYFVENAKRKS